MTPENLVLVADNLQLIRPSVAQAVEQRDAAAIQALVKGWLQAGAQAIDINTGPLARDPEKVMTFLVQTIKAVCNRPLLLDTVNPIAIRAGLKAAPSQAIINGLSLQPHKMKQILPLAVRYQVPAVCYLLKPDGQVPPDAQTRLEIALELWQTARSQGLEPHQLIIDPILVPLTWNDGTAQAAEVLATLKYLPEMLGFSPATIIGLSNLTSGAPSREKALAMEAAYLPMLAASGIGTLLMNIEHHSSVALARNCSHLTSKGIFSWQQVAI